MTMLLNGFKSVDRKDDEKSFCKLSGYKAPTLRGYYNYNKPLFESIMKSAKRKLND